MKWTPQNVAIAAGLVILGVWYVRKKAGDAAQAVGEAVDITSKTNLASRAAESWWGGGSDGQGSIGTDFYDWTHDPDRWWNLDEE